MSTEIASLSLEIDSSSAVKARADQDALTESGGRLEKQVEKTAQAQINANYASYKAAQAFMNQRVAIEGASAEVQKILGRYDPLGAKLRQLQTDFTTLDKAITAGATGGTSDAALDKTMKSINEEITKTKGLMVAAGAGTIEAGVSMKSLGLNTQIARRELMMLGREALHGDFARMPQTMMSLATHSNIMGLLLNPVTIGFVALGAAAIGVAVAFFKGAAEAREMSNALHLTSGYAGMTRESMLSLAASMTEVGAITVGNAKEIVTALVTSGQVSAQAIGAVARLASDYAAATGKDVAKIAPELVKLFADPAKGAEELNKQMHFLSTTEIERIRTLERSGQLGEAQLLLAQKLSDHLPKQISQLGLLETAWDKAKKQASAYWDAALGIGRPQTIEGSLKEAQEALERAQRMAGVSTMQTPAGRKAGAEFVDSHRAKVVALQSDVGLAEQATAEKASAASTNAAQQKVAALVNQLSTYEKIKGLTADITNIETHGSGNAKNDQEAILKLRKQIRDITNGEGAEARALAEVRISGATKAAEDERNAARERTETLVKLGILTAQQGEERKRDLDLESLAVKKSGAERTKALVSLMPLERERQVEVIKGIEREMDKRRQAFADWKALRDAARIDAQSKADASASQSTTGGQLGNLAGINAELLAMERRMELLGATNLLVAQLAAAERNRQIALIEYDAATAQLPEDDPYIQRLRAQAAALRELRDAELQYAADTDANQRQLTAINQEGLSTRERFRRMTTEQQTRSVADDFVNNISAAASYNKKAFEIAKAAAIANALIAGYASVMNAIKWGSAMGGYVGAVAAGAAMAAAVAVQISAIQRQQFQGGGGNVVASGGGGFVTAPQAVAETRGAPVNPPVQVTVVIQGNLVGNQEFIDNTLIPGIKDAVDNRDFTIIGKNSRQAAELTS